MTSTLVPPRRRPACRSARALGVALAATLASACSGSGDGGDEDAAAAVGDQAAVPASPDPTPADGPDGSAAGEPAPSNDPGTVDSPAEAPTTPVDVLPTPSPEPEPTPEPVPQTPEPQVPDPAASLCAEDDGARFCVERSTRLFSASAADGSTLWSFTLPGDEAGNDVRDVVASDGTVYLIAANADGSLERSGFEPGGEFVDTLRLFDALAPAARDFALPDAGEALVLDDGSLVLGGVACGSADACRGFVATVDPADAATLAYRELGPAADAATAASRAPGVRADADGGETVLVIEVDGGDGTRRWRADALVEVDAGAGVDALAPPPAPRLRGDMLEPAGRWLAAVANGRWLEPVLDDVDELIRRVEADVPADAPATGRPANPASGTVACDAGTTAAWERENLGTFADRYRFDAGGCLLGGSRLDGTLVRTRANGGLRERGTTASTELGSVVRAAPGTLIDVPAGTLSAQDTVSSGTVGDSSSYGSARSVDAASFGVPDAPTTLAASAWSANGFVGPRGFGPDGTVTSSEFMEGYFEITSGGVAAGTWTLGTEGRLGRSTDDLDTSPLRPVGTGATVVTVTGPGGDRLEAELVDSGAWRYRLSGGGEGDPSWRIVPSAPGGSFLDALWPE